MIIIKLCLKHIDNHRSLKKHGIVRHRQAHRNQQDWVCTATRTENIALAYMASVQARVASPGSNHRIMTSHQPSVSTHQTLLTIFLQTGLLGLFVFLNFYIKIAKKYFLTISFFASFSALTIYILGGDIMRRLPIWLLLLLLYYWNPIKKLSLKIE